MKKLLVIILSVAMLCTASVAAFAANPIRSIGGTDSVNVSGTYVPGGATSTVYYVDITWGSMEFTYTDAAEGTWNPQDHTYDNSTAAAWSCADGANKITVTNHSNAPVKATLKYETATGFDAITGTFDKGTLSLVTAVGTAKDNAPAETALLTLSGALSKDTAAKTKIGTVTVTLGSDN